MLKRPSLIGSVSGAILIISSFFTFRFSYTATVSPGWGVSVGWGGL